jgi:hypothetical protein
MREKPASHIIVPPSLVRRVMRVRERFRLVPEYLDEVFDDFFVLWRAFESTVPGAERKAARAEDAVVETLAYARRKAEGIGKDFGVAAPRLVAWAAHLRLFQRLSHDRLADWFSDEELTAVQAQEILKRLARLSEAARAPERWRDQNSHEAGWTLYRIRSAVFHASVDTSDDVAIRLAPLTCAALIELNALRVAFLAQSSLADAWRLMGGPDDLGTAGAAS